MSLSLDTMPNGFVFRNILQKLQLAKLDETLNDLFTQHSSEKEVREALIQMIDQYRQELNIDPAITVSMQHPDEWDILPQPVIFTDVDGATYTSIPEKALIPIHTP